MAVPRPLLAAVTVVAGLVGVLVVLREPAEEVEPGVALEVAEGTPSPSPSPSPSESALEDVPALDAALWLVDRHPDYFRSGEAGLGPWLEQLPADERARVVELGQRLTAAWLARTVEELSWTDPAELADATAIVIRSQTLNQLELDFELFAAAGLELHASLEDPYFEAGVFARLVRGASNCDGQSHLHALLINEALAARSQTAQLGASIQRIPSHALVAVHGSALSQAIYTDAWSNLPAFCLDAREPPATPLAELDEHARLVPGLAGREPVSAETYAALPPGEVQRSLAPTQAQLPAGQLEGSRPALDPASLADEDDSWRLYLLARVLGLHDDPRAHAVYDRLLSGPCAERRPVPFECAAAASLRARLRGAPRSLEPRRLDQIELGPWRGELVERHAEFARYRFTGPDEVRAQVELSRRRAGLGDAPGTAAIAIQPAPDASPPPPELLDALGAWLHATDPEPRALFD